VFKRVIGVYHRAYSGLPGAVWILALVEFINECGAMVFPFLTLYLTQKLHFSPLQAGKVISAYGVGALIGSWLGGKLSDRLGVYRVQLWSLGLAGAVYLTIGYLASFKLISLAMFIQGILLWAFHPANAAAVSRVCSPEQRSRGYALNRTAAHVGISIGPALGGLLALMNYRILFWVDGLSCLAAALLFGLYFKDRLSTTRSPSPRSPAGISPLKDPYFLKILGLSFLIGMIFNQLMAAYPLYLRTVYGIREHHIGGLFTINSGMIILFEMPIIGMLRKQPPGRIVSLGSLVLAAGFAMTPLGDDFFFAVLAIMVWTSGEIMILPTLKTLIAGHAHDSLLGSYMGLYGLAQSLALIAGPAAGMWVYQTMGPDTLWAGIGLLGIALGTAFPRPSKNPLQDNGPLFFTL
jgi:predicted MFS family arabinose efflux permease